MRHSRDKYPFYVIVLFRANVDCFIDKCTWYLYKRYHISVTFKIYLYEINVTLIVSLSPLFTWFVEGLRWHPQRILKPWWWISVITMEIWYIRQAITKLVNLNFVVPNIKLPTINYIHFHGFVGFEIHLFQVWVSEKLIVWVIQTEQCLQKCSYLINISLPKYADFKVSISNIGMCTE